MIQGLCRVCGSGLEGLLVVCPACTTPHHADCWEYNRGCSIYGCRGAQVSALPVSAGLSGPVPRGPARLVLDPRLACAGALLVFTIAGLAGAGPALAAAAMLGGLVASRQPRPELEPVEQVVNLEVERKAVTALLGSESVDQLAQAYALFECRHPTLALEPDEQGLLARELLDAGHRTMGLLALDKALAQRELDDAKLLDERRNIYASDPATVVEGLAGPLGPSLGCTGLEDHLLPMRRLLARTPEDGTWWLLSLSPRGWCMDIQLALRLPGAPEGDPPMRGTLLAGPFSAREAREAAAKRWDAHQAVLLVPEAALALPPAPLEVISVHLSQKAAVFRTATGESDGGGRDPRAQASEGPGRSPGSTRLCSPASGEQTHPWEEVRTVALVWLDTVKIERELHMESRYDGGQRTVASTRVDVERIQSRPLLEVHCGADHKRLRIDAAHPGLFDYLGRRREASHATNIAIVARDLARFAPAARVSHGLSYLLSGRPGPAQHFPDPRRVEEYIHWLHATGSPEALEAWRPVWRELVGYPA